MRCLRTQRAGPARVALGTEPAPRPPWAARGPAAGSPGPRAAPAAPRLPRYRLPAGPGRAPGPGAAPPAPLSPPRPGRARSSFGKTLSRSPGVFCWLFLRRATDSTAGWKPLSPVVFSILNLLLLFFNNFCSCRALLGGGRVLQSHLGKLEPIVRAYLYKLKDKTSPC